MKRLAEGTIGNVDCFSYEGETLYAEGWVFDPLHEMKHPVITFYQENKCAPARSVFLYKGKIPCVSVYRKDVAEVLKNDRAESAGFF